jgi:phosphoglycolate phosphatase-like HAD superfamily hydrolase
VSSERRHLVWAFDVDGCLVDSLTGTSLRPGALEVLGRLRDTGATVLLWSAGGREHAVSRAAELRFAHLIDAVYAKERRGADGRWGTVNLPPEHQPDVFVDDWPDEAPVTARLVAVSPYIAPNPHDRGLAALLAELTAGQDDGLGRPGLMRP